MEPIADRQREVAAKLARLRTVLAERQATGILLTEIANTAWITAGASTFVNTATDRGSVAILVTPDEATVLADRIEAPRLMEEERLEDLGFTFTVGPWYAHAAPSTDPRMALDGAGAGPDLSADLRALRRQLEPTEVARFREVGSLAAQAMAEGLRTVRPGMTEFAVAGRVASAALDLGGWPIVNLVAADARIAAYRHPLPTMRAVERYVMAVLCLRKDGLVASITRLLHFGPLPDDLRAKALAVATVDARMILGTQAGRTLGEMFALARQAYADVGYPEAIEQHHQGGMTGYQTREVLATPDDPTPIQLNQAFAWNPSVRGVKSEDTILLTAQGHEVITAIAGWPTWDVTVDGITLARPAMMER